MSRNWIIDSSQTVLVTGANGFIGSKVVETLLGLGFSSIRCLVRPTSNTKVLEEILAAANKRAEILSGNLLSAAFCDRATQGATVIYHLAAGIEKSFAGSFLNTVVTTRNLLDAAIASGALKRFVNVSSFAVYSTLGMRSGQLQDENCPIESEHMERHDAYGYAKTKQEEIVREYGRDRGVPYVVVRPGAVYGQGTRQAITGRVGIDTFGVFLHLGGSNRIPLTYVDNCAEAIVLSGLAPGIEGEVFNIVDDDPPTSRRFLSLYKQNVRRFKSVYVPYPLFLSVLCHVGKVLAMVQGQLPPAFNRRRCAAVWKRSDYSNRKLKELVGWSPRVPFQEATQKYFQYLKVTGGGVK